MFIHNLVRNCIGRRGPDEISDVQIVVRSQFESLRDHPAVAFATLNIAFGVESKAKIEERSGSMSLRQIDAASQRSVPSFSAILTGPRAAWFPSTNAMESFWSFLDIRTHGDGKLKRRARCGIRGSPQAAAVSLNDRTADR
jgi:hypothetical protein